MRQGLCVELQTEATNIRSTRGLSEMCLQRNRRVACVSSEFELGLPVSLLFAAQGGKFSDVMAQACRPSVLIYESAKEYGRRKCAARAIFGLDRPQTCAHGGRK